MSSYLDIQTPAAGASLIQGETYRIIWTKTLAYVSDNLPLGLIVTARIDEADEVITHIAPSANGPKVGDGAAGYEWEVPFDTVTVASTVSDQVTITLYYGNAANIWGVSDTFSIKAPLITITTPAADETIRVGTEDYAITWTADGSYQEGEKVHIYLVEKHDNYEIRETQLTDAETGIDAIAQSFTFDVTDVFTGKAYIKIVDRRSDGMELVFKSGECELVDRSLLLLTGFDENVIWYEGETYTIDWQALGFDVGDTIQLVIHDADADRTAEGYMPLLTMADIDAQDNTYDVTVPNDFGEHSVFLELLDQSDDYLYAWSETFPSQVRSVEFIAPNRGTVWYGGKTRSISWKRWGFAGTESVTLDYRKDGGAWTLITDAGVTVEDESYAWSLQEGASDLDAGVYAVRLTVDGETFTSEDFYIADDWLDFGQLQTRTMLVAVANNQVWYEDIDAGRVMKPVKDFYGQDVQLHPDPHVALIPAFQKVYVCDGTFEGFWKLDLVNIRLQGTVPSGETFLRGATLTQTNTGAQAVFDEAVPMGGDWYFYAYRTNANDFSASPADTISGDGVDEEGNPKTVILILDDGGGIVEPPHWLDWTLPPDDSKGALPQSASIGCLYRGRITLAGNKNAPHQWYQARQGDPLDFLYIEGDAQSAIAGSQGDAGAVGDILTALIPAHDDYLIFGCAHEMWILRGDAAAGGSLDILTNADGVFGPTAWCFDGGNRLYYVGTGGMYRMVLGETGPENLTALKLPNFMMGLSRQRYNIHLAYDRKRIGIVISIVCIDEGDNYGKGQTWWYDLKTEGFFPETYLKGQVPFSLHDYGAQDGAYEHLLLGFHDGYIRRFDETARSDISADDEKIAIDSYVVYPPLAISSAGKEGKLTELAITTGGSAIATDAVDVEIYLADTAQQALDKTLADGVKADIQRTITGTGRGSLIRDRGRGAYLALRLANHRVDESFAVETITARIEPAGRIRS